jgi:hypothetical protein
LFCLKDASTSRRDSRNNADRVWLVLWRCERSSGREIHTAAPLPPGSKVVSTPSLKLPTSHSRLLHSPYPLQQIDYSQLLYRRPPRAKVRKSLRAYSSSSLNHITTGGKPPAAFEHPSLSQRQYKRAHNIQDGDTRAGAYGRFRRLWRRGFGRFGE